MNVTAALALKLVPSQLRSQLVFLCVDDTMVSKFGTKFENVSNLFDHAAHYGSNYLSGHCFVSLMLCVPVRAGRKVVYQSVPLGVGFLWACEVWRLRESPCPAVLGQGQAPYLCLHHIRPQYKSLHRPPHLLRGFIQCRAC